jgi:hypothetical protein
LLILRARRIRRHTLYPAAGASMIRRFYGALASAAKRSPGPAASWQVPPQVNPSSE